MTDTTKLLDPVCDMVVAIADARDQGLTLERPEREYAFCGQSCVVSFAKTPERYIPKVDAWVEAQHREKPTDGEAHAPLAIDQGVRAWYKSCRCCLSEAHPEVVAQLDAESGAPAN
ncbi:MAG TPA: hypothetical protein VM052_06215 [Candidatus Limnocylindrales bacterium]|nr:hypothetical protein [Candidatus Limnocylindrales bacterium]